MKREPRASEKSVLANGVRDAALAEKFGKKIFRASCRFVPGRGPCPLPGKSVRNQNRYFDGKAGCDEMLIEGALIFPVRTDNGQKIGGQLRTVCVRICISVFAKRRIREIRLDTIKRKMGCFAEFPEI